MERDDVGLPTEDIGGPELGEVLAYVALLVLIVLAVAWVLVR